MTETEKPPITAGGNVRPFCGLCGEPKFLLNGLYLCEHCDTTVNCLAGDNGEKLPCGRCAKAAAKTYPVLPDD